MAQEYGNGWAEGVHPEDLDRCFAIYTKNFDEREAFSMEYRLKNRFGEYRWILDIGRPYYDLDQSFLGYIGSCYDITQQKENEENLKILSITDPLTQVNNRLKLDSELELELSKAERYNIALTTILIDIDDFKKVNDTLGHLVGDSVLVQVACLLKDNIRLSDTLGRWGGEEFLIICPNTDQEAAKSISEKLRIDIENHKFSETLSITCSFGVANFQKGDSSHKLLKRTDDALYLAKKTGKNQVSGV